MSEIPEDIREIARELALEWAMPETEEICEGAIANAIMAERERCLNKNRRDRWMGMGAV